MALADLLKQIAENKGVAPQVNPPEAAKVLAEKTAAEVRGEPEPEAVATTVAPPTAKPAEVLAAENEPKVRRTAAVVQAELDALVERFEQEKGEHAITSADLAKAHERAERAESDLAAFSESLTVAKAKIAELEGELIKAAEMISAAVGPTGAVEECFLTIEQHCEDLTKRGFVVDLKYVGPAASR